MQLTHRQISTLLLIYTDNQPAQTDVLKDAGLRKERATKKDDFKTIS